MTKADETDFTLHRRAGGGFNATSTLARRKPGCASEGDRGTGLVLGHKVS